MSLLLLSFSGCAIHTPFQVVRYWADYNTERRCNAQIEFFDHLPPKTARVKLMRWGYNVGPECQSATGTMGIGTGVWADRFMPWTKPQTDDQLFDNSVPPTPPLSPTPNSPRPSNMPPEAMPVLPPPAPPAEPLNTDATFPDPLRGNLSTARPSQRVSTVGYQADAAPQTSRVANAAWMFAPPARTPKP